MHANRFSTTNAQQVASATRTLARKFLRPACKRLLHLTRHEHAEVRVYATVLLASLVCDNLPAIPVKMLGEFTLRLRMLAATDPDERVKKCAAIHIRLFVVTAKEFVEAHQQAGEDAGSKTNGCH